MNRISNRLYNLNKDNYTNEQICLLQYLSDSYETNANYIEIGLSEIDNILTIINDLQGEVNGLIDDLAGEDL